MAIKYPVLWYSDNIYGSPDYLVDDNLNTYCQQFSYVAGMFSSPFALFKLSIAAHSSTSYNALLAQKLQGSNDSTNGNNGTWTDILTFSSGNLTAPSSYPGWCGEVSVGSDVPYLWYRITGDGTSSMVIDELSFESAGVVGHWTFDNMSGNVAINEVDGGDDLTLTAMTLDSGGKWGDCVGAASGGTKFATPDNAISPVKSVSFWFKRFYLYDSYHSIMLTSSDGDIFYIDRDDDTFSFYSFYDATKYSFTLTFPEDQNWHHVVLTQESSDTFRCYLDGVASSETVTVPRSFDVAHFGYIVSSAWAFGGFDNIQVYSGLLSADDVVELYGATNQSDTVDPSIDEEFDYATAFIVEGEDEVEAYSGGYADVDDGPDGVEAYGSGYGLAIEYGDEVVAYGGGVAEVVDGADEVEAYSSGYAIVVDGADEVDAYSVTFNHTSTAETEEYADEIYAFAETRSGRAVVVEGEDEVEAYSGGYAVVEESADEVSGRLYLSPVGAAIVAESADEVEATAYTYPTIKGVVVEGPDEVEAVATTLSSLWGAMEEAGDVVEARGGSGFFANATVVDSYDEVIARGGGTVGAIYLRYGAVDGR